MSLALSCFFMVCLIACPSRGEVSWRFPLKGNDFLMSSSTLMPIEKARPWKEIEILPGQTVLESAVVRLPPVKVATYFLIQWLGDDGQVLSKSRLFAVPKDIARSLSTITSNTTTGLLDQEDRIKPMFKQQKKKPLFAPKWLCREVLSTGSTLIRRCSSRRGCCELI